MNIFQLPKLTEDAEVVEILLQGQKIVIERIISTGQASPEGFWYDQEEDEWVIVLQGSGKLVWEDGRGLVMNPGDWLFIPSHERHRVEWTSQDPPCIWLAVKGDF